MSEFKNSLKVYELPVCLNTIIIGYSITHGYLFNNSDSFDIFVYSSTFYFDIKVPHYERSSSALIVFFEGKRDSFGALRVEYLDENDNLVEVLCCAHRSRISSAFLDKFKVAIPLPLFENVVQRDNAKIRIWTYSEIENPIVFRVERLAVISYPPGLDITRQIGDFSPSPMQHGWRDTLRPLIDAKWSPLHFAAHWHHPIFVEHLIRDGYHPDHAESNGGTALHRAADSGSVVITDMLLNAGANVNAVDRNLSETPLNCAQRKGEKQVAQLLTDRGAVGFAEL